MIDIIELTPEEYAASLRGTKNSVIRRDWEFCYSDVATLLIEGREIPAVIYKYSIVRVADLNLTDAIREGHQDLAELLLDLANRWPDLHNGDLIAIAHFEPGFDVVEEAERILRGRA